VTETHQTVPRVLMFAYRFPPCNCWPTASQRAYGLARGLADRGWHPVVITRLLPVGGCACGGGRDDDAESTQDLEVVRVPTRGWRRRFLPRALGTLTVFIMGGSDNWASKAKRAAKRYATETKFDLVWTTSGPIGTVRPGRSLQRSLAVPWVADVRDSVWRTSVQVVRGTGMKAWFLRTRAMVLARPLRSADAVIHVTLPEAQADTAVIRKPPRVIPSGFDEKAWSQVHFLSQTRASAEKALKVLFAGRVYAGWAGYSIFLEGVRAFAEVARGLPQPVRVEYMGPTFDLFRAEAERSGSSGLLVDRGVVSLARSRAAMLDADALLLVTAPDTITGIPGGKLYEYLAACRPILAVPGSDPFVRDVLERTRHGWCLDDADAVRIALERLAAGTLTVPSWPSHALEEFTWSARGRQLAEIFEHVRSGEPADRVAKRGSTSRLPI
jgi:hypothetical protein